MFISSAEREALITSPRNETCVNPSTSGSELLVFGVCIFGMSCFHRFLCCFSFFLEGLEVDTVMKVRNADGAAVLCECSV